VMVLQLFNASAAAWDSMMKPLGDAQVSATTCQPFVLPCNTESATIEGWKKVYVPPLLNVARKIIAKTAEPAQRLRLLNSIIDIWYRKIIAKASVTRLNSVLPSSQPREKDLEAV
jgi:aspartate/glutamate racemase